MMRLQASQRMLYYLLIAGVASSILLLLAWHNRDRLRPSTLRILQPLGIFPVASTDGLIAPAPVQPSWQPPPCRALAGGEEVLVVMKTGATELEDKLITHLNTTLLCYPNHIIFSDFEEDIPTQHGDVHVYDAFKFVSPDILKNHDDFAIWRKVRDSNGRSGLLPSELSGADSRYTDEEVRIQIPGWKLDKWKFLPMVNQTFYHDPNKHWYVFVEADTSILWSSLLSFLHELDWTQDHYIGAGAGVSDIWFAHGGSGFVLSKSALKKVVAVFSMSQSRWEAKTDRLRIGDHILAEALRVGGIQLWDAKPVFQGDPAGLVSYHPQDGLWCEKVISFHHQSPPDINQLWEVEQAWIKEKAAATEATSNEPHPLLYRDVFVKYVLPLMRSSKHNWNNTADISWGTARSLSECRKLCVDYSECVQYALHTDGDCRVGVKVVYGEVAEGVESGWLENRVQEFLDDSPGC